MSAMQQHTQPSIDGPTSPLADHLSSLKLVEARSLRGEKMRLRLLEAAKTCFSRLGYENCTVDDIAREAGASRPSFYVYFQTKAAAAEALADSVGIFILKDLEALASLGRDATVEDLTQWVRGRFATTAEQAEYMRIFRHVAAAEPTFPARTRARYDAQFGKLGKAFPAFARAAADPAGGDALKAHLLLSRLDQVCMDLIAGWDADERMLSDLLARELSDFLQS